MASKERGDKSSHRLPPVRFHGGSGDLQNRELFPDANVYIVIPANGSARPTLASASFHTVKLDREKDDLAAALLAYGYDMTQKGLFSWMGRSWFYEKEEVEAIMRSVAVLAVRGTSLLMDYIDEGVASSPARRMIGAVTLEATEGEKVNSSFTYASIEAMLEKYGFVIYEHAAHTPYISSIHAVKR